MWKTTVCRFAATVVVLLALGRPVHSQVISTVFAQVDAHSATLTWVAAVCTPSTCPNSTTIAGYNVYRKTGTGNVSKINAALVTTLTYKDSVVTPGAIYTYTVRTQRSDGIESVDSGSVMATIPGTVEPPPTGCITSGTGAFKNNPFPVQTGTFSVEFDSTPNMQTIDSVIGLSNGAATGYNSLGPIVRFVNSVIDARNGNSYAAMNIIPFTSGVKYHFRLVVRRATHTYDVFVKAGVGAEVNLATNYTFRTEQATVAQLNNWATTAEQGTVTTCMFTVNMAPPPVPVLTQTTCTKSATALTCVTPFANMPANTPYNNTVTALGITRVVTGVLP